MTDKTVDLTKVTLCNDCKADLKKKHQPVDAFSLHKAFEDFKAWISQEIQAIHEEIQQVQEDLQEEEDFSQEEDLPQA